MHTPDVRIEGAGASAAGTPLGTRILAVFFSFVLAFGLVPVTGWADEGDQTVETLAVSNTYGSPDSAKLITDQIGKKISTSGSVLPDNATSGILQDGYISLVGPYQFNTTGNTNVRGKFDAAIGQALHSSRVANEKALVGYDMPNVNGMVVGGSTTAGRPSTNSSSARLAPGAGENTTIAKAFLVVSTSQCSTKATTVQTTPLAHYGMCFMGPSGTVNRHYPSVVYKDNNNERASCFFDVTDFVKKEGYGWYTAINIPCTSRTADNTYAGDVFASWKLILVEENIDLAPRMMRLKLGGTSVGKGNAANVTISGEGLSVVGTPSGELLFAMDGSDFGDSEQHLNYTAKGTGGTTTKNIANAKMLRSAARFFSLRIDNRDFLSDADFDPGRKQSNSTNLSGLNGGKNITLNNTDLSIMDIEKEGSAKNPDGMTLKGGESEVVLSASTNNAPTILEALGLTLEIVTPNFKTSLAISNLTKHYSTADEGYEVSADSSYYADDGDKLRATMLCQNTSPETKQYLGLSDPEAVVTVNGFKSIDEDSIVAYFAAKNGEKYRMANVHATPNADGSFTVSAQGFVDDGAGASTVITTQGFFEISFTGDAVGTQTFTSYSSRASIQGNFVDENDGRHDFMLTNLGLATATTASNEEQYDVTVTGVGSGSGTVTGTGSYFGSQEAQVTWQPDAGSHVSAVFVDSAVRDDLVKASEPGEGSDDEEGSGGEGGEEGEVPGSSTPAGPTTFTLPIDDRDHEVVVVFAKDDQAPDAADPEEDPDGGHSYTVKSVADGGIESITPSASVKEGATAQVSWKTKPGYRVTTVLVDGVAIAAADAGSVTFSDIASAHTVQVLTERTGSGGSGVPFVYTSLAGKGTITPSSTVQKGSAYDVAFKGNDDSAILSKVTVNGKELYNEYLQNPMTGNAANEEFLAKYADPATGGFKVPLSDIQEDQQVQVVYRATKATVPGEPGGNTVHTDLTVGTSLSGGMGEITPAQSVAEGAQNVQVTCTPGKGYHVSSMYMLRGTTRAPIPESWIQTAPDGSVTVTLPKVDSDCTVHAVLSSGDKPGGEGGGEGDGPDDARTYTIETSIVGGSGATITATQINIDRGDRRTISWTADADKRILSVMVDGALRDDLLDPRGGSLTFDRITADHEVVVQVGPKSGPNDPGTDPDDPDDPNKDPNDPDGPTPGPGDDAYYAFINVTAVGPGTAGPSVSVPLDKATTAKVTWQPHEGARVAEVWVDGRKRNDLLNAGSVSFAGILRGHDVRVVFAYPADPSDPDGPLDVPDCSDYATIATKVVGGMGSITGTTRVDRATTDPSVVEWQPAEGYHVHSVTIDGVEYTLESHPDLVKGGRWEFNDFAADHNVVVRMALDKKVEEPGGNTPDKPSTDPDDPSGDAPKPGPGDDDPVVDPVVPEPIVIDPTITIDPVPGGTLTKDDIIKLVEELYPDDPRIPEGVTPEVTITKDGKEHDQIDQSEPGEYLIEVVYTDPLTGQQTIVRIRYLVSSTSGEGDGGIGAGAGGLGSATGLGVESGSGLAKTGDTGLAAAGIAFVGALAAAVVLVALRRRSQCS